MARHFLYVLRLTERAQRMEAWSENEHAAVNDHFAYLSQALGEGRLILAGRTEAPGPETFGLVIFEADNEAAARAFMAKDPAVARGLMTAELHPYRIALHRPAAESPEE